MRPAATPCRTAAGGEGASRDAIPDLRDTNAPKPTPGDVRISKEAKEARLRRVFTPNIRGQFKVPAEIVAQYKNKKGRRNLEAIFQSCGFSPDLGDKNGLLVN